MLEQRQHLLRSYFKTLSGGPAGNRTRASLILILILILIINSSSSSSIDIIIIIIIIILLRGRQGVDTNRVTTEI